MNILPKKRWHVRTKENIARVRKDEAEAAEKERQERLRVENADREARLSVLKHKSKQKLLELGITDPEQPESSQPQPEEHVNLFADSEHAVETSNRDHDKEVKEKKEEYEKKIGYLTYLGQDTNEALKKKNWYEVLPDASRFTRSSVIKDTYEKLVLKDEDGKPRKSETDTKNGEVAWKSKQRLDPIQKFITYCSGKSSAQAIGSTSKLTDKMSTHERKRKHKSKKKSHKAEKDDKHKKLLKLREERLKREQQEKFKTEVFLSALNPTTSKQKQADDGIHKVKPKYNSQFNPQLARQNYT